MTPPPNLVELSAYPGPDADRLREDVAAVGALTVPVLDVTLQPFLTGSWVWPGVTSARAVAVRIGLGLPDIAPVRRELDQMMADQVWAEDDEELLAGGRFASGGRWGLLLARLDEDAATAAVLVHLWSHDKPPGFGLGLVAFAPGLDPRPELPTLLPDIEALRTEDVPRSARIGLARGSALMARAARFGVRSARAEDPDAAAAAAPAGLLAQLAPDRRERSLGVFRLTPSAQPSWWRPEQVATLVEPELAALLAGHDPTPGDATGQTTGATSPTGADPRAAGVTRRRVRAEAVLVPVGVVVAILLAIGLVLLLVR